MNWGVVCEHSDWVPLSTQVVCHIICSSAGHIICLSSRFLTHIPHLEIPDEGPFGVQTLQLAACALAIRNEFWAFAGQKVSK